MNMTKVGTPFFMSPEMHNINVGSRELNLADIWSLGIIMYNLMFGRMPFDAHTENELK